VSNVLGTAFATAGFSFDPNLSPNNQAFSLAVLAVVNRAGFGTGGGGGGTGSVTSVAGTSIGTGSAALVITGSPITTSGTLTFALHVFDGTNAGVVPASAGGSVNFLRADGSFAVPGGTSTGSVTSVSGTDASTAQLFGISGVPITTSGIFTMTLVSQPKNTVFAGPNSGANAQPSFRLLAAGDVPHFLSFAFDQVFYSMAGGV